MSEQKVTVLNGNTADVEAVKAEYKKRRTRQLAATLLIMPPIVVVAVAGRDRITDMAGIPMNVLAPIALVLVVAGLGFSFYNWRCPSCKKYLGRDFNPRFCAKCGVELHG